MSAPDNHDDHGHDPHGSRFIQHHYDDAGHQFDSGKLGIWFFLGQEVLFFSALFVAYILYRHQRPEIFQYAHYYLDVTWGAINTVVLIVSSLSAAWAVRCAQLNQRRGLIACLVITIVCACGFLGIKYVEYAHKVHEGILYGSRFDPCVSSGGGHLLTKANACDGAKSSIRFDPDEARYVGCLDPATQAIDTDLQTPGYQAACRVFEVTGQVQGKEFVESSRREIAACRKTENPRAHQEPADDTTGQHASSSASDAALAYPCHEIADNPAVCPLGPAPLVLYGDRTVRGESIRIVAECDAPAPPPVPGDVFAEPAPEAQLAVGQGTVAAEEPPSKHERQRLESLGPPPEHTSMFFTIYFAMTGLHGLHVLVGIGIFIWLLIRAVKGHFTPSYFGPVDYAALYWHLVDLIWIFLFPLLYLIH